MITDRGRNAGDVELKIVCANISRLRRLRFIKSHRTEAGAIEDQRLPGLGRRGQRIHYECGGRNIILDHGRSAASLIQRENAERAGDHLDGRGHAAGARITYRDLPGAHRSPGRQDGGNLRR